MSKELKKGCLLNCIYSLLEADYFQDQLEFFIFISDYVYTKDITVIAGKRREGNERSMKNLASQYLSGRKELKTFTVSDAETGRNRRVPFKAYYEQNKAQIIALFMQYLASGKSSWAQVPENVRRLSASVQTVANVFGVEAFPQTDRDAVREVSTLLQIEEAEPDNERMRTISRALYKQIMILAYYIYICVYNEICTSFDRTESNFTGRLGRDWIAYQKINQIAPHFSFLWYKSLQRLAAYENNAFAQFELGDIYYNGASIRYESVEKIYVKPDVKKALRYYTKAGQKGHSSAQWSLILMAQRGMISPEQYMKSRRMQNKIPAHAPDLNTILEKDLEEICSRDSMCYPAFNSLAVMQQKRLNRMLGNNWFGNSRKAMLELFSEMLFNYNTSYLAGNVYSCNRLAQLYAVTPDTDNISRYLQTEEGKAQFVVTSYKKKDLHKIKSRLFYLKESADRMDDGWAQRELGNYCWDTDDVDAAELYYRKASDNGDKYGAYNLAKRLYRMLPVSEETEKIRDLLDKGKKYREIALIKPDADRYREYLELALDRGVAGARLDLAVYWVWKGRKSGETDVRALARAREYWDAIPEEAVKRDGKPGPREATRRLLGEYLINS